MIFHLNLFVIACSAQPAWLVSTDKLRGLKNKLNPPHKYEHIFNESRCDWMPLVPGLLKSHLFFTKTVYVSGLDVLKLHPP